MGKERLGAFIDAVLAIIMTILVLELEKPQELSLAGFWELRASFLAYAQSFFWLGAMWVNLHYISHRIEKVSQKTVWSTIVMLFFSSLFPYATKLIAMDFMNSTVQAFYGIMVLLITFSVQWHYQTLYEANPNLLTSYNIRRQSWAHYDIGLKIIGLLLTITIFPTVARLVVLITLLLLVIPNQLK